MQTFFDAHTHIHFPAYDVDREDVLARAKAAGVKMITVGTQWSTSYGAVEFAKAHPGYVWATVGFHPAHFSADWHHDKNEQNETVREVFDANKLRVIAKHPKVVAIGECGLDFYRDKSQATRDSQREGFLAQIELAHEVKKPLMIHCRSAFTDLIEILKANSSKLKAGAPGVIHFFSGAKDEAKKLLDMGFAFTFGGVVTFARDYDEVIKMLPLEAILSETDSPYVAPAPYRGKRNEPAYVVEVVKKLAELKGINTEEMAANIFENAKRIFALDA
ncbi:MAG: TatD family hydrolase [bacterium]|nr:TatD family hydrolase [bacterium]